MRLTLGVHGMPMQYPGDPSAYSQLHSINCACDAKRSIVPHEPCAPKCWKTKNQKTKNNRPNRPDPKPKTKILVLVFGFSENQKPKKTKKNQTQQSKSTTKIWVLVFGFSENQKHQKNTCPFWFWSGLLGLFFCSFLVFGFSKNQKPKPKFWFLVLGLIFVGFCFLVWSLGSVSFC